MKMLQAIIGVLMEVTCIVALVSAMLADTTASATYYVAWACFCKLCSMQVSK